METTDKIIVNGVEYRKEEVLAMAQELKDLTAIVKAGRKSGMLKKAKAIKEDDPRKMLLAGIFEGVITEQVDIITELFKDTMSDEKPFGNTGINICIKGIEYDVQILSDNAKAGKTKALKDAKDTKGTPETLKKEVDEFLESDENNS